MARNKFFVWTQEAQKHDEPVNKNPIFVWHGSKSPNFGVRWHGKCAIFDTVEHMRIVFPNAVKGD